MHSSRMEQPGPMKYLITGATGLLGNNIVRLLVQRGGAHIRCLVRPESDPRPLEGLPVERITGDITRPESLIDAHRNVSIVIHAAACVRIGWTDSDRIHAVNALGTANIAAAALKAGARLVHISTVDALPDNANPRERRVPYVASKISAELAVLREAAAGLNAVIVNPGFVLGPWDWKPSSGKVLLAAATRWIPFSPRGNASICDARDVAAGVIAAAERGARGESYVLAGHNMSWKQALRACARLGSRHGPYCRFDPLADQIAGVAGDLFGKLNGREPDLNSASMLLARRRSHYHSGKAVQALGYKNRPIEFTLADSWAWFYKHGYL